ncbi:hypothetical protein [Azohydromonas caseinilytica]|uniref:Uncharacterized protein n=1 Tax=Azohydromonas caseinilytica TaxID=2728836 RepID=A0A848FCC8_9BURK|nr:hypothetical protein [Azohydromonas caseinilytica]NML16978.1 hypothetical protein [Azohydromonas caseinilytica]
MSQLGPVIGNRLADAHKAVLKPHLRERLVLASSRSTAQGTLATGADGRLSFTPKDDPLRGWDRIEGDGRPMPRYAFRPGQRVRVSATVGELLEQEQHSFEPEEAATLAGREGVVVEHAGCASLGLVLVMLDGMPWAFMPAYLARVCPAEGDDELAAMAGEGAATAFNPYSEPLALGDTVQGLDGRVGRVTLVQARRLGMVFEHGSAWTGDVAWRTSFRLLAKAGAWGCPDGCPF